MKPLWMHRICPVKNKMVQIETPKGLRKTQAKLAEVMGYAYDLEELLMLMKERLDKAMIINADKDKDIKDYQQCIEELDNMLEGAGNDNT